MGSSLQRGVFLILPVLFVNFSVCYGGLEFLSSLLGIGTGVTGCPEGDLRCGSGECILAKWRCDAQIDCRDGSDETDCPPANCSAKEFRCDTIRCLPIYDRCDGQTDCKDGSDEDADTCQKPCPASYFRCSDGRCIPEAWKCDKEKDCKGGDDEAEMLCRNRCSSFEWSCQTGQQCIPAVRRCDGYPDCRDGSDELSKECAAVLNVSRTCNGTDFRCLDGNCIPERWLCDGNSDCSEAEDEKLPQCVNLGGQLTTEKRNRTDNCMAGDVACADGNCIPKTWYCDGAADCDDGSDELNCKESKMKLDMTGGTCEASQVSCMSRNGTVCLSLDRLCDDKADCLDGIDEGQSCHSACSKGNGQCSHICHPTPLGPVCSCPRGYTLAEDKQICEETDPCTAGGSLSGPCSQICHSFRGGHLKCGCADEFLLESDGRTCKPVGLPLIAFAVDSDIHYYDALHGDSGVLLSGHSTQMKVAIEFSDQKETSKVFFTDKAHQEIIMVENGLLARRKVILEGLESPEGLTYDWMAENLYYADAERPEIGVCSVTGNTFHCAVLIPHDRLHSPRGLAVHPEKQYLFFSQWRKGSSIERTLLDGSSRQVIVNRKIHWPNALVVDLILDRLYWLDAHNKWIEGARFDGSDRRIVVHLGANAHPYGLTILGNHLYWSDWFFNTINSISTNSSGFVIARSTGKSRPMSVLAIHPSRQPAMKSPCAVVNGSRPCQHLCLARSATTFVCVCQTGYRLVGVTNCAPTATEVLSAQPMPLIPSKLLLEHKQTEHPCRNSADCDCEAEKMHAHDVCVCMANRCRVIISKSLESHHSAVILPQAEVEAQLIKDEGHSTSTLAGIICACVLFVFGMVIVIFLFRKHCVDSGKDDHDQKSLLDADPDVVDIKKKPRPCPGVLAGFNNPIYENVPSTSNYSVRFYKTRPPASLPETPASHSRA